MKGYEGVTAFAEVRGEFKAYLLASRGEVPDGFVEIDPRSPDALTVDAPYRLTLVSDLPALPIVAVDSIDLAHLDARVELLVRRFSPRHC